MGAMGSVKHLHTVWPWGPHAGTAAAVCAAKRSNRNQGTTTLLSSHDSAHRSWNRPPLSPLCTCVGGHASMIETPKRSLVCFAAAAPTNLARRARRGRGGNWPSPARTQAACPSRPR